MVSKRQGWQLHCTHQPFIVISTTYIYITQLSKTTPLYPSVSLSPNRRSPRIYRGTGLIRSPHPSPTSVTASRRVVYHYLRDQHLRPRAQPAGQQPIPQELIDLTEGSDTESEEKEAQQQEIVATVNTTEWIVLLSGISDCRELSINIQYSIHSSIHPSRT